MILAIGLRAAEQNVLKNAGFEEAGSSAEAIAHWITAPGSAAQVSVTDREAHSGSKAIAIPANSSLEQRVESLPAGAYLARCWVKSEVEQSITFLVRNPDEPWVAYNCAELKVSPGQWTRLEVFCPLDRAGPLAVTFGGVSKEFHLYHGTSQDMNAPVIADDFELVRYEPV